MFRRLHNLLIKFAVTASPYKKLLKTSENSSLIAAGFYIFYNFCSDPDQIFKNKNWCKNFNLFIVTSNKVYFIDSVKTLNVL